MNSYLRGLLADGEITPEEYQVLAPSGARSPEELYALTAHFAGPFARALPGGNLARISAVAAPRTSMAFKNAVLAARASPRPVPLGARQPPNASPPIGASIGLGGTISTGNGLPALAATDHHSSIRQGGWPIKDQGQRGTCVAHAMAACKEHHDSLRNSSAPVDQSEQYLFWGAKQFDANPADGTSLTYALDALRAHGSCDEVLWPYNGTPSASVHQGPPPPPALQAGQSALHLGGGVSLPSKASKAMSLYTQLQHGPVSIGVPVFADPNNTQINNWNVGYFFDLGIVANPPPLSIVEGGHAVCVVGFEPDPTELAGVGWFIFKNSWGPQFGHNLPSQGTAFGPEPGYGQIGWSYVDSFLWEMAWL